MSALRLACVAALGSTGTTAAEPADRLAGPVPAAVVKVRDGDTLEVDARVWPNQTVRTAVRLRGVDAPELRARCATERQAAEAARDRLARLVSGGEVELVDIAGDKYYGRVLATVSAAGAPDVGATLLKEGLVAPYRGEKRRDWCAGTPPTLSGFRPVD